LVKSKNAYLWKLSGPELWGTGLIGEKYPEKRASLSFFLKFWQVGQSKTAGDRKSVEEC
jgi:hypothetical protein